MGRGPPGTWWGPVSTPGWLFKGDRAGGALQPSAWVLIPALPLLFSCVTVG